MVEQINVDLAERGLERGHGLCSIISDPPEPVFSEGYERRPFAARYGLVCYIRDGYRIAEVGRQSIELIGPPPIEVRMRAHLLDRIGGCEISPSYCDVILRRTANLTGETPVLLRVGDGQTDFGGTPTFEAVAALRGVPAERVASLKAQDARAIKHNGPNPHYGLGARRRNP